MATRDILYAASGGSAAPIYVEDVFSTYLYTGNNNARSITNNIDVSGKGGLVWIKVRNSTQSNVLQDTTRAPSSTLLTNSTNAATVYATNAFTAFNSDGFSLGVDTTNGSWNTNGNTYVSWTFRKQPKFFDVVTYTGNGVAGRTVAHSLGSVPGMIIIKCTNAVRTWTVWHRSFPTPTTGYLILNNTDAVADASTVWNSTLPTSTNFTLGTSTGVNNNGDTYVAYLFAHDAGGFGLSGNDNVISCGSFTTDASGAATINLGYEPQYVLIKNTSASENWKVVDIMRGFSNPGSTGFDDNVLFPNLSNAENAAARFGFPTATGFNVYEQFSSNTYIYMAIRRGPMATPTLGTSVFSPQVSNAAAGTYVNTGFPLDAQLGIRRTNGAFNYFVDRLRGVDNQISESGIVPYLATPYTSQEFTGSYAWNWDNTGYKLTSGYNPQSMVYWNFRRAPGFFDQVCYTGTGSARTVTHNLGAAPELMIVKVRSASQDWTVYSAAEGASKALYLNTTLASANEGNLMWNSTAPTSSVFTVGPSNLRTNSNGQTYVAYLFASVAGVSKVGSYTGTGTTQTINCGFTTGARFVLIKRTDSTGGWYVWDSARGIVAGNDPYLLLNSTAAEVTNTDYIDTAASGFEISSTAPAEINANGGTYIYLAIA